MAKDPDPTGRFQFHFTGVSTFSFFKQNWRWLPSFVLDSCRSKVRLRKRSPLLWLRAERGSVTQARKVCVRKVAPQEREQGWRGKGGKKLSSDYNYGTWHLADFKSGRPNFTKAVNGGSELARSLPNQKFALYNFTQSDFSTVIQCNQVIRGEH